MCPELLVRVPVAARPSHVLVPCPPADVVFADPPVESEDSQAVRQGATRRPKPTPPEFQYDADIYDRTLQKQKIQQEMQRLHHNGVDQVHSMMRKRQAFVESTVTLSPDQNLRPV